MTVLDFVRYHQHLKGTKIGCREGDCGACTIMVGTLNGTEVSYRTMTSCLMPLFNATGKHIVTIEGINPSGGELTPVQLAMVEENATQCGFCTVGFIMSLTSFCLLELEHTVSDAIASVDGNICRCTGYKSIERAATRISAEMMKQDGISSIQYASEKGIVPPWFGEIRDRLIEIQKDKHSSGGVFSKPIVMNGGTDLYVQRPEELVHDEAKYVFDQPGSNQIIEAEGRIEIGGSVTMTDLLDSPMMNHYFPKLHQHLKLISSTPIRNMATVAGNIVNASPIGDWTICLLALDATIVLRNGMTREMPLRDFYQGYKSLAKTADEIVEKIYFPIPHSNAWFNFEKVSKRRFLDIASVNTAISLRVEDGVITEAHVSAGGVSPIPLFLKNTSSCLMHQRIPLDPDHLSELDHILQSEIHPISDVRGSVSYKRLLLQQLFHVHLIEYSKDHA